MKMNEGIRRLPAGGWIDAATGSAVGLRHGRGPRVIFAADRGDCADCGAYIDRLVSYLGEIQGWGGRAAIVVSDAARAERLVGSVPAGVQVMIETDEGSGVKPPALLIADEWGEVHFIAEAVADHALPDAQEIVEWVRFIATHCPECEQAEGEWRSVR